MLRLGVPLIASFLLGLVMTRANAAPPEADPASVAPSTTAELRPIYQLQPIGWVRKTDGRTSIELYEEYRPALLGGDALDSIWVLYWFDRNDTPEKRSILRVHPQGNKDNPKRGVFATHSPVRPNLIAMTRCKIISVKDNVIEIDKIDAFADTPVLDLKN